MAEFCLAVHLCNGIGQKGLPFLSEDLACLDYRNFTREGVSDSRKLGHHHAIAQYLLENSDASTALLREYALHLETTACQLSHKFEHLKLLQNQLQETNMILQRQQGIITAEQKRMSSLPAPLEELRPEIQTLLNDMQTIQADTLYLIFLSRHLP